MKSEYPDESLNNVYKDTENVVLMEDKVEQEERTWTITRVYRGILSCEEAIKKLLEIHVNAEEDE